MKNGLTIYLAIILLGGCASLDPISGNLKFENLVTPYLEQLNNWDSYVKSDDEVYSRLWQKPGKGMNDFYSVSVMYNDQSDPVEFRRRLDTPGTEQCDSFSSTTLQYSIKSAYDVVYWETLCAFADGFTSKNLQMLIGGNDSLYHIIRTWKGDVPVSEVEEWKSNFESVYVCDSRRNNSPCPDVEKNEGFSY